MQPCNRIYFSKICWKLNMFRAAYRSSSGDPNCICSLWFIYTCGDRPLSSLDNGRSPHVYINQRLQIQFGAPDDERYAARNMLSLQKKIGIINSIIRLHLVVYFYWFILGCTDPWILNLKLVRRCKVSAMLKNLRNTAVNHAVFVGRFNVTTEPGRKVWCGFNNIP
jgi:hypothetical protein